MDINLLCEEFIISDITDVSIENNFFIDFYNMQKELFQKILKARYLLEQLIRTNSQNPILDNYFFYYDKNIEINLDLLTIEINSPIEEQNQFVDKEYIDLLMPSKYQAIDAVSSYIYQQVITGDIDTTRDIILTSDYFLATYFNYVKKEIKNSTVSNVGIDNKQDNEIVGLIELEEKLIKTDYMIPMSIFTIKASELTITIDTLISKNITLDNVSIERLHCSDSNYLINNLFFKSNYVTYDNLYLKDTALIGDVLKDNTNMVKVIDLITELGNTKAPKVWQVPYLVKTDSGTTNVSDKIVNSVLNNTDIDTNEPISYEELVNSINSVLEKVFNSVGECK